MRGSDSLPPGKAFTRTILLLNRKILLVSGLVSVGIVGFATLRRREISPIEVLMLVAGATACLYATRTFSRSMVGFSLGFLANLYFAVFLFDAAIDTARAGDTIGALLTTAVGTGLFVVPAICMTCDK